MKPIDLTFPVHFNYQVHFTEGLFQEDNTLLSSILEKAGRNGEPNKIVIILDQGVLDSRPNLPDQIEIYCQKHRNLIQFSGKPLVVQGGEPSKNDVNLLEEIHEIINEYGICRHSYVIAIGGGAVLDMVGYASATAHRGIRLIRVPTTVLSQNDSGVGVKNGVNYFGKKNFLGTFAPPFAVLNDADFLTTLDDRDWRSGCAEAIKVALIKDPEFFVSIGNDALAISQRDMKAMQKLIYRCAELHMSHIGGAGDPFELGSSRPLDFGHWSAHKLEHLTEYALRHGEAVAIGMSLDTTYSYLKGYLPREDWEIIIDTLSRLGFALHVPELSLWAHVPNHPKSIFRGLTEFREHLGGELTLMMLNRIGEGFEVHEVEIPLYQKAISILEEICGKKQSA